MVLYFISLITIFASSILLTAFARALLTWTFSWKNSFQPFFMLILDILFSRLFQHGPTLPCKPFFMLLRLCFLPQKLLFPSLRPCDCSWLFFAPLAPATQENWPSDGPARKSRNSISLMKLAIKVKEYEK